MKFAIEIADPALTFNAAHFVSFNLNGRNCAEPIHSHDFKVSATVTGELEDGFVVDFIAARDSLIEVLKKLQHLTILARKAKGVEYSENLVDTTLELQLPEGAETWSVPTGRILWLDAENASAERIAESILEAWLASPALTGVAARPGFRVALRLEEAPGSFAIVARD